MYQCPTELDGTNNVPFSDDPSNKLRLELRVKTISTIRGGAA